MPTAHGIICLTHMPTYIFPNQSAGLTCAPRHYGPSLGRKQTRARFSPCLILVSSRLCAYGLKVRYFLREECGEFVYLALELCVLSLRDVVSGPL